MAMRTLACLAVFAALSFAVLGCKPEEPTAPTENAAGGASGQNTPAPNANGVNTTTPGTPSGGNQTTIAPMAGVGAGPMTPVSGSESLQGGGSAAGQVLKDKAKGLAGQAPSSLNQAGGEEAY